MDEADSLLANMRRLGEDADPLLTWGPWPELTTRLGLAIREKRISIQFPG
jgi:hypothetical protein